MASLELKRNVRVTLGMAQMFTFKNRLQTLQNLKFAAGAKGNVTAMNHHGIGETSSYEDYAGILTSWSHMLYWQKILCLITIWFHLILLTPTDIRAPEVLAVCMP